MKSFEKGSLGEALAIGKLVECGYVVALPMGAHHRYDLIVERHGKFWRVQVKTLFTELLSASLYVPLCSTPMDHNTGKVVQRMYSGTEIDALLVCWQPAKRWFWLPFDGTFVGQKAVTLRLLPTINSQEKKIRWAKDFEI